MGSPKSGGVKEDTDVDVVGDSPSNTSGEADPSSSLGISVYIEGERVFAYHGPRIYESKVQKVEMRKVDDTEEKRYFVHYLGWNKNWDEWVGPERLLKFTEENKKLQEDLKLKQQGTDKNPKSGRSSHMKPKSSAVGKGKKRKSDFSIEEKDTISNEKLVKIQIPSTLKKQLVDDWEFVVQLGKLVKLPHSPCVDDILKRYLDYKSKKDGMLGESVGEILKGLRCYFDKALPVMLLYKMEGQQYQEAITDDVSPSSVYGAEHLLRLFAKLPELLAYANIEEEASMRLRTKLIDLLKYLQKNQSTFFLSAYDNPKGGVVEGSGKEGEEEHKHSQNQDHDHHHHHHHHGGECLELSNSQKAVLKFAKAIGWTDLAEFLRENLQLCCCSAALLLCAAVCPYLVPKSAAKLLRNAFISIAFPLVGPLHRYSWGMLWKEAYFLQCSTWLILVTSSNYLIMITGSNYATNLLMFVFCVTAEEYFTSCSIVDVKELKDGHPDFAIPVEMKGDKLPHLSDLSVPVDGEVSQERLTITIEHLTSEAKPVEMKVGDRMQETWMVTKTWNESTLNRIVQLTEEAQLNKPKLQRWLDEFGEQYSKVVVALSLGVAILGPFLFKWPFIGTSVCRGSVYRALGLMVAASPCALAVAPLAYATAISACASKGILLKGGHVFDALASCNAIAFDKTGTLTTGELMCKAIEPIHGHQAVFRSKGACCTPNCEKEALAVAAAMEKETTHPIGRAVVDHSMGKDLPTLSIENFESLPGRGLYATLAGVEVKQSVALALTCIIFAALPSVLGFLPLWLTVLLHEGGTLLVCLNSICQDFQLMHKAFMSSFAMLLRRPPVSDNVQAKPA
ncbi:hypothetical protein MKX01_022400 [Papaver californicum]|nr:hypothetical protein MKX01_022400 [Papaver californicum]